MKKELTIITIPALRDPSRIENDLRFEYPNMSGLRVFRDGKKIFICWKAVKYSKDEVEKYVSEMFKKS